jgi:hypothetical protein
MKSIRDKRKIKRTIEPRDLYKDCAKTTNNQTKMITYLNDVKGISRGVNVPFGKE